MIVDLNSTRSLVEIYKSVDYVMCELSGPYFSAIYNKTKILVLDHHSKKDMHLKIKSILNDNLKFYLADEESIKKNKKTLKQYFEDCDFWLNQEKTTDKLYDIFYGKKKISKDFEEQLKKLRKPGVYLYLEITQRGGNTLRLKTNENYGNLDKSFPPNEDSIKIIKRLINE